MSNLKEITACIQFFTVFSKRNEWTASLPSHLHKLILNCIDRHALFPTLFLVSFSLSLTLILSLSLSHTHTKKTLSLAQTHTFPLSLSLSFLNSLTRQLPPERKIMAFIMYCYCCCCCFGFDVKMSRKSRLSQMIGHEKKHDSIK